jgi:Peptidase S24-like
MATDFRALQERLRKRLLDEIAAGQLTGLQLARDTGFRQAHISNFLNCKRGLSLQAMDEIMRARKLTLENLLEGGGKAKTRRRSLQASSAGVSWIPLVDAKNCLASDVPFALGEDALQAMSKRLGRLCPKVQLPRPHWQRFVAMRVTPEDVKAMPRQLVRGAVMVIDRHSNAAEPDALYVVRQEGNVVVRYLEQVGGKMVLRADNSEVSLKVLQDPTEIVGRVCVVIKYLDS